MTKIEKVAIIGLGYIGLPTAATLAAAGMDVVGIDISERIVNALNNGEAHFSEPDLDGLVRSVVDSGKLVAKTGPVSADAYIIAVPTPIDADKNADMSYVEAGIRSLAPVIEPGQIVILESTSPVGSTRWMADILRELRPDLFPSNRVEDAKVHFAYCPERILPGRMVHELINNDRVIGGLTNEAAKMAAKIYESFVRAELIITTAEIAELCKLIENAYRDVNIAFANEIANICDANDLDVYEAIRVANHHPRVNILTPGPGVGGHCIAVDPWFLISRFSSLSPLMRAARHVNDGRPALFISKIRDAASRTPNSKVALLGLAYKPDVDDLRESPAVEIVRDLGLPDTELLVVEPNIDTLPKSLASLQNVRLVDMETAISEAGVVAILVAHREFKMIEEADLNGKTVIDATGLHS